MIKVSGLKEELINHIADIMELPKDVMLNVPKITVLGDISVFIENHSGIAEFTLEHVKVNSPVGVIEVKGDRLRIKTVLPEEIIIEGQISGVIINRREGRP